MKKFAIVLLTSGLIVSQVEAQSSSGSNINNTGASNIINSTALVPLIKQSDVQWLTKLQPIVAKWKKTKKIQGADLKNLKHVWAQLKHKPHDDLRTKLTNLQFAIKHPQTVSAAKLQLAWTDLQQAVSASKMLPLAPGIVTE